MRPRAREEAAGLLPAVNAALDYLTQTRDQLVAVLAGVNEITDTEVENLRGLLTKVPAPHHEPEV